MMCDNHYHVLQIRWLIYKLRREEGQDLSKKKILQEVNALYTVCIWLYVGFGKEHFYAPERSAGGI